MAGTFAKASRPYLAGSYFDFVAQQPPVVNPSQGSIVVVLFTHTWGPLKTVTVLDSFSDFLAKFAGDPNNPSSGHIAVRQAFRGSGTAGEGGAGRVLAYRMGAAAAAKATKILQNTGAATALTLTAKYEGSDGNTLHVTTQDYAPDATKNQLLLLDGNGVVLETYTYLDADIAGLAGQINLVSQYLTAVANITGTALSVVSNQVFAGGNDGTTLLAADYTAALSALEVQRFGVLTFENLTDNTIQASTLTWLQGQQAAGRRFFTVFGGALDEAISVAVTRSAALADPNVLNVGVGHVVDHGILDVSGNPVVLSTAQLAPRIAGVLASRGERMSLTFTKLAGLDLVNGAAATGITTAYDNGVIVLSRASDANASVRIEKGLTTFTLTTDASRPKAVFSQPKFVATMQGLQNDLTVWADENIIGSQTVDDDTRHSILAYINSLMKQRQDLSSIQAGWTAIVDPNPPPSDSDNFVAFLLTAKFGRSVEQVFFTAQVG